MKSRLILITGLLLGVSLALFAIQNSTAITVQFAIWEFQSPLALIILGAFGLGLGMAIVLSIPGYLSDQWQKLWLRSKVSKLGHKVEKHETKAQKEAGIEEIEV